jgi:hypothetical protein
MLKIPPKTETKKEVKIPPITMFVFVACADNKLRAIKSIKKNATVN